MDDLCERIFSTKYLRSQLKGVKWVDFFHPKTGNNVLVTKDGIEFAGHAGIHLNRSALAVTALGQFVVVRYVPHGVQSGEKIIGPNSVADSGIFFGSGDHCPVHEKVNEILAAGGVSPLVLGNEDE